MNTLDVQYPEILDRCMTHLQDGSMSLETCLAQYPLYADQLQQDLSIFQLVQDIPAPSLSSQSVDDLEAKLLAKFNHNGAQAQQPKVIPHPQQRPLSRRQQVTMPYMKWVAGLAIMFMLLIGGGGGTVMASANSLPGDNLYAVKLAWEQVIVFLATLVNQLDDVWLSLTETRADEIVRLYDEGRLTDEALDQFYITAETAVLYASDDTEQRYLIWADAFRPIFAEAILLSTSESRQFRILRVLSPSIDSEGHLTLPGGEDLLPQSGIVELTPTFTPTIVPSATFTATFTSTPTVTFTPTATDEPTVTRTSTPTRTPTLVPSATLQPTSTLVPTATWTPLGVQPRGDGVTVDNNSGEQVTGSGSNSNSGSSGSDSSQFFIRETQQSVELTQTAIALTPTETPAD